MDEVDLVRLYDYYGDLLTQRQKECFEMRQCQYLSLGEIASALGISRQGVHDNLSRTEALLRKMEAKTGCVSRDRHCRKAADTIQTAAQALCAYPDEAVRALATQIAEAIRELEE